MAQGGSHGYMDYRQVLPQGLWSMVCLEHRSIIVGASAKETLYRPFVRIYHGTSRAPVSASIIMWNSLSSGANECEPKTVYVCDDVMIFLKPKEMELRACSSMLEEYGVAFGLHVNLTKSTTMPIRCSCIRKPSTTRFQGLVDQLASCFAKLEGSNTANSRRLLLIQIVLCAIQVY